MRRRPPPRESSPGRTPFCRSQETGRYGSASSSRISRRSASIRGSPSVDRAEPTMLGRIPLLLLAGMLLASGAAAAAGSIEVEKAWARATMSAGATGVVYLTIDNTGSTADRLTGVSTPAAAAAGVHVMVTEGTVMQMRSVDALDV